MLTSNSSTAHQIPISSLGWLAGVDVRPRVSCSSRCVCRLDRLVSGVLILARSRSAVAQLQKHMFEDFLEKEYVARVKVRGREGGDAFCT